MALTFGLGVWDRINYIERLQEYTSVSSLLRRTTQMDGLSEALAGPIQQVLEGVKASWKEANAQEPLWHVIMGFVSAINWQEPWIMGLLLCHCVLLVAALTTRRRGSIQACLFLCACGTILMGERLNSLGRQHWQSFASQNYFDISGVFFTSLVSGPLLLLLFILLGNYLYSCIQLLVEAKRKELKFKARQRNAEGQGGKKDS